MGFGPFSNVLALSKTDVCVTSANALILLQHCNVGFVVEDLVVELCIMLWPALAEEHCSRMGALFV